MKTFYLILAAVSLLTLAGCEDGAVLTVTPGYSYGYGYDYEPVYPYDYGYPVEVPVYNNFHWHYNNPGWYGGYRGYGWHGGGDFHAHFHGSNGFHGGFHGGHWHR